MRSFDFAPLYRSSVGFDRFANLMDSALRTDDAPSYPPYNIERTGEDTYRITMAVAGTALAWGPDGHRSVCEIAYLHLDKAHQREVNRLANSSATLHWMSRAAASGSGFPFGPCGFT